MRRRRGSISWPRARVGAWLALVWLALVWLGGAAVACTRGQDSQATNATRAPARGESPGEAQSPTPVRVGNQVGGVEDQPDYDAEAEGVRRTVEGRMPDSLPSRPVACKTMLDAVKTRYRRTEGEGAMAVRMLDETRSRDLEACTAETPASAAACVTVLMADEQTEYPRALDLCTRAFPR
jgi:hypothetical protein